MIKVVIVEDVDLLRKGLIYTFNWNDVGCIVVGEAENGIEGIKVIEQFNPDIVLVDIQMPFMDGLTMLQNVNNLMFETIIMTSYAEFEYAKKAIDLNVSHFLLKPIEDDKLVNIIQSLKSKIHDKKAIQHFKLNKESLNTNLIENKYLVNTTYSSHKIVKKVVDYIHANYQCDISLQQIAKNLEMSPSYLSRTFKQITSCSINDYINRYRITKAIEYLKKDQYRLYEIAEMVGFNEYKYFHHVFVHYMKHSPKVFIRKLSERTEK